MRQATWREGLASVLQWRLGERKTGLLLAALFALVSVMAGFSIGAGLSGRPYGDFFAMWSFARFAFGHPAAQIYDPEALQAFQRLYVPDAGQTPFPYPPFYLLFLAPFGVLPIGLGWAIWSAGGLGAYLGAIFAGRWRSGAVGFMALAPASLVALISGQNSLFSAALIVGGLRLAAARPLAAGVLIGAASFKPQLGLLVPVALLAARAWRCLGAAIATVIGLGLAATAAFGPSVWPAWIAELGRQWSDYVATGNITRRKMPTIGAGLEQLGVAAPTALGVQVAALLLAAGVIWLVFRRRWDRWAVATLLIGCLVATPYALFYDLPVLSFALLLAVSEAARTGRAWSLAQMLILLGAYLAPYDLFLIGGPPAPVAAAALVLLFAVLAHKALTTLDAAAPAA